MRHKSGRWIVKLLASALLYPVMQFVVLPLVSPQGAELSGQEKSVWNDLLTQLKGSSQSRSGSSSSDQASNRSTAESSPIKALSSNDKVVDVGGHQIVISPALNSGNSVRFETGKNTASSSANCKPGKT